MSQQDAGDPDGVGEAEAIAPAGPAAGENTDMLPPWELGYSEDYDVDDEEVDDYLDEVDEMDEMDMEEDWDGEEVPELDDVDSEDEDWISDDEEDYLSAKQRVHLECGVLQHDANFFVDDRPTHHSTVHSSTCHHQTADAVTFLPRPGTIAVTDSANATAASVTAASVDVEEVVVSHRQKLSIYQLAADKPARLLARSSTCFRHYSIAASPCGNFVAASGNHSLVVLFRVQRSNPTEQLQRHDQSSAEATAAAGASKVHGASANNNSRSQQGQDAAGTSAGSPQLPWQLVHEATLLCAAAGGRESMVNSVRFGQFGGGQRLLVSHQDGMLYLFNLPDQEQNNKAAAAAAAAAGGSASASGATPQSAGAALMVKGLPDWEPQGSQINRKYVEQLMPIAHQHMQLAIKQQPGAEVSPDAEQQHQQEIDEAGHSGVTAAGQKRQQQQQQGGAEAAKLRRINPEEEFSDERIMAVQEARVKGVSQGLTQLDLDRDRTAEPSEVDHSSYPPGSLKHLQHWLHRSETLLSFVVEHTEATANVSERQLDVIRAHAAHATVRHGVNDHCGVRRWQTRFKVLEQMLQDDQYLQDVQRLQQMRYIFPETGIDFRCFGEVREYSRIVGRLREAVAAQEDMVGLRGQRRQQQQWQRQQDEGDVSMHFAVIRGVYLLLLLRLLAPSGLPTMKQNARVLVIKHGPAVDPSVRLQSSDMRAASRMSTCAISNVAPNTAAQQRAAAAAREARRLEAAALQPGASAEMVTAAANAAQDAQAFAAEQQTLPLNICESSPDGSWLAVGVDQAGIVLVPAGPGYQHQCSHVLDLCPLLSPRTSGWQQTGTLGCQYLAFNSSSTLLAATSDHLRLVSVFEVASGQLLATFSLHNRPVLPVRFMSNFIRRDFSKSTTTNSSSSSSRQIQQGSAGGEGSAASGQQQQQQQHEGGLAEDGGAVVHELWGDRVLVYCESRGGVHIADMSVFLTHKQQPLPLPKPQIRNSFLIPTLDERECSTVSSKFCLKTYLEVPAEPEEGPAAVPTEPTTQQQQQQQHHQDEAEAMLDAVLHGEAPPGAAGNDDDDVDDDEGVSQKINGLVVTPAGRVLVAAQHELLEWQLLTGWSIQHHKRFPPVFKSAVQLLLTAAAHPETNTPASNSSSTATTSTAAAAASAGPSGAVLFSRLPDDVLKRIVADAALPQGAWARMKIPSQQQLLNVLHNRPRLPESDLPAHMMWPWNMLVNAGFNPAAVQENPPGGQGGPAADQLQFQDPAVAIGAAGGAGVAGGPNHVGALHMLAQIQAAVGAQQQGPQGQQQQQDDDEEE